LCSTAKIFLFFDLRCRGVRSARKILSHKSLSAKYYGVRGYVWDRAFRGAFLRRFSSSFDVQAGWSFWFWRHLGRPLLAPNLHYSRFKFLSKGRASHGDLRKSSGFCGKREVRREADRLLFRGRRFSARNTWPEGLFGSVGLRRGPKGQLFHRIIGGLLVARTLLA
jgi:hypothetical protein